MFEIVKYFDELWTSNEKRDNKMYLRDKYPEAYFSKLFYPLSLQLQPWEAASVLWLAYADSEAKALKSAAASSLSSPPQGQADLSCLSLCRASHLSWDTYAHFTCSMKHLREHMIKNQRWGSGPLQCFSEVIHDTGNSYHNALTGTPV